MSSILINSLVLNSLQKQSKMKSQVSFYLELDLRKFGFLDFRFNQKKGNLKKHMIINIFG